MNNPKLVNWQEQMKVLPTHFRQSEDFFIHQLNDLSTIFSDKYGYGLLSMPGENKGPDIQIREDSAGDIEVSLYRCNAVTASGNRIHFIAANEDKPIRKIYSPAHEAPSRIKEMTCMDIILTVNPFERVAVGELNPHESPPRHPDCEELYSLHITPSGELNIPSFGAHYLVIGRILKQGEMYIADNNYIPPCREMQGHPELAEYYKKFDRQIYKLQKASLCIIGKVSNKPNGNELAASISLLSETIVKYIASIHFIFKNYSTSLAPVMITNYISTMAYHCFLMITSLSGIKKEELLRYFYEWSDITPGSFEELLANTLKIEYDHSNIRPLMLRLEVFLSTMSNLLERLSHLEYIGQHKESLVVSEREEDQNQEQKKDWFITN
ncbi:MAG: type VI secretion system membrane-associated complex protein TssK [Bacteroidales bacterium]